jgi:ribosomal protein S12 methylthiotransferase
VRWIRVLYAYPAHFSERLIETMRDLPNVVPYLDIPLQHSHDEILARMNRKGSSDDIRRLVGTLREKIDGIAIRTTFIVGFPGERERHFRHLMRFIEQMRFDRAGVFTYSRENGTPAARFPDQVPEKVKESRRAAVMSLQQEISLENNRRLIGTRLTALIDGVSDRPVEGSTKSRWFAVGRTYRDAPEIDGQIWVDDDSVPAGTMAEVEVTDAEAYDLIGRKIRHS